MKVAIGIFAVAWLLCGVAGASMLGDLDMPTWKGIARGPITLVEAISQSSDDVAI